MALGKGFKSGQNLHELLQSDIYPIMASKSTLISVLLVQVGMLKSLSTMEVSGFPIGVAPIMAMQLSNARRLTLKVRMFLQKYVITGICTRCEGGIPEPMKNYKRGRFQNC